MCFPYLEVTFLRSFALHLHIPSLDCDNDDGGVHMRAYVWVGDDLHLMTVMESTLKSAFELHLVLSD